MLWSCWADWLRPSTTNGAAHGSFVGANSRLISGDGQMLLTAASSRFPFANQTISRVSFHRRDSDFGLRLAVRRLPSSSSFHRLPSPSSSFHRHRLPLTLVRLLPLPSSSSAATASPSSSYTAAASPSSSAAGTPPRRGGFGLPLLRPPRPPALGPPPPVLSGIRLLRPGSYGLPPPPAARAAAATPACRPLTWPAAASALGAPTLRQPAGSPLAAGHSLSSSQVIKLARGAVRFWIRHCLLVDRCPHCHLLDHTMSSVRVQLKDILKINGLDKQLIEALALVNRLTLEKKPLAVVYNLTADLFMEQSLLLKDPEQSKKSISHGLIYYEKAAELAPNCVETAAAHGGALIALQLLGSAEVVLRRGIAIRDGDCDHPFVNHIGITPASGTKDQLIAEARLRMKKDLDYIKECHEGLLFNKVLMQLNNTGAQCSTILSAAKELADKQHGYARAKLLYPHVVLCLMRSGLLMSNQLTDQKRESILQSALKGVLDLVADFPNSLIISLYCAKLQISLGFFDAAEKEHRRALEIVNPDDPRDHEIPFGSTKGVNYMDRVLYTTLKTIFGLIAPFHMFESTFRYLLEESKGSLLSVKVDNMLGFSQNEQGVIHEAVDYYKTNQSWVLWRCFWKDDSCKNFVASTPEELVLHVFRHTSLDDDGTILEKLLKHTLNDDMHCILDLAKDDEGHDVFCIKNLDVLFKAIFDVLTDSMMETTPRNPRFGAYVDRLPIPDSKDLEALMEKTRRIAAVLSGIKMETISPDSALDDFVDYLSALDLEKQDAKTFKVLEELWVKVLKSCVIDKQRALMALIATLKWGEIKEIIENQIAEAKTPDLDTSPENETLMQIPEMKGLEKSVAAAKPCHHAFMYGHRALQRRINALSTLADKNKMAQQEGPYDPYMEKTRHQEYVNKPTPPHLSHLVLCSACYFERANLRRFIQILHHFVKLHDSPGVKCQICAVRFVTASALAYHMDYIHNVNLGNEQPSSK